MAYETEEEQLEALRRWWQENGRSVIAGVIIAIAGVVGWQQWQAWQERSALEASAQYDRLNARTAAGEGDAVREALTTLQEDSAGSPYATLGSLAAARYFAERDDFDAAMGVLRWAVDNAPSDALRRVARLRLGAVEYAAGELEAALATLEPVPDGAFAARYHELRGDVLVAAGRADEAITAYRDALEADPLGQRRGYVEVKLTDLGAEPPEAS
ncbi:YfgM family protein [Arhodomonas sp. SL1]|uniref:YfgM family protein n=1 Tax=Arhodomonas sp. SL1 TaxID=3425691 RepID=UPI003F88518E